MTVDHRMKVLFLCTGNSCRSQIAEGWARSLHGSRIAAYSAGTVAKGLDPRAVVVMAEAGIDIADHRSKTLADLEGIDLDLVITVCSHADANCPVLPDPTRKLHRGFDDPPALARDAASDDEALEHYRRVRDEIRAFVSSLPDILSGHV